MTSCWEPRAEGSPRARHERYDVKELGTTPLQETTRGPRHGWGARVSRWRVLVLSGWLLLIIAAAIYYPSVGSRLATPDYTVQGSESAAAQSLAEQHFPAAGAEQEVVVFRAAGLTVGDPAYRQAVARVLAAVPSTAGPLTSPYSAARLISADRHVALATLAMGGSLSARAKSAADVQKRILAAAAGEPVQAYLTGPSALTDDLSDAELRDQNVVESVGVPIALLVLLAALGGVAAALAPILVALSSVLVCTALLGVLAGPLGFDRFVTVVATVIGIGIGIDYSLFMISRFREEIGRGLPVRDAIGVMLRTSGRVVVTSGLIVMVALGSMALVRGHIFREVAASACLMVACCMIASLVVLPAVLAVLGPRVNWGALRRRPRSADPVPSRPAGRWAAWARFILRHPYRLGLPAVVLLAVLALPVPSIKLGVDWGLASLTQTPSGRGQQIAAASFGPGVVGPVQVIACDGSAGDAAAAGMDRLAAATADRRVSAVLPTARSGDCAYRQVVLAEPVDSPSASAFVRDLRSRLAPAAFAGTGVRPRIGGLTAQYVDLADETTGKLPVVILFILAVSFCYLLVTFRSIVVPAKAVVLNLAATVAALGATTWLFQQGHGGGLLRFTSSGTLQAYLPIALFALLFGLSMDYEVFLVSRIREEWLRSRDDHSAIPEAMQRTARQISAAASIMVIVFGSLLFAHVLELKQFGFGLAFAVLLDATLVRLLLVPAVMSVAGRANWWLPAWLDRLLPASRNE
jgi:putative drug exporter of the RND superfamily